MSDSPRVLVLAGGLSHEREVSLRSGRRVADALRESGCEVLESDLDAGLLGRLRSDRPDLVWPLLHGATGEDGSVRDVLDVADVPYVGADAAACRRAFDKPTANDLVGRAGIAVPTSVSLPHSLFRELGASEVLAALVGQDRAAARGETGSRRLGARGGHRRRRRRAAARHGRVLRLR